MNPELLLDENADWIKLNLMSTMSALIGWESGRALFKLSNEEKQTMQKHMKAMFDYLCDIYLRVLWL